MPQQSDLQEEELDVVMTAPRERVSAANNAFHPQVPATIHEHGRPRELRTHKVESAISDAQLNWKYTLVAHIATALQTVSQAVEKEKKKGGWGRRKGIKKKPEPTWYAQIPQAHDANQIQPHLPSHLQIPDNEDRDDSQHHIGKDAECYQI